MSNAADSPTLESQVLSLYDANRYTDAHELVERQGGIDALTGAGGRALAGRLASVLGADRYGASIHLRAWRSEPDANALGYFVGMAVSRLWGPVRALELLDAAVRQPGLTSRGVSEVQSARAYQFGMLRDYDQAEAALDAAFEAEPERLWLFVTKGYLLGSQDRHAESIAAVREALERRPWYRPAVLTLAHSLVQQDDVDEARRLLIDAGGEMQSGMVLLQLAQLERELSMYESAQQRMRAALPMLPLRHKDRDAKAGYAGFAATLAYDVGDIDEAIRLGEESGAPFHKTAVANLREHRDTGRRVVLDVGFTLQHDVTCVPATVSTLTKFWGRPTPHLDIAEAICYDGTPAHTERAWVEEKGFFCREFTLTWEAALALIDAGLPFTQTLTGYTTGHIQAVIGYDSRRGVLLYRDPSVRHAGEVLGKELIEQMQSSGPRGMVFVPEEERARVEAVDLPDHELWTLSHQVSLSLAEHRRDDAAQALEAMRSRDADHRLALHARARIASYDGDFVTLLEITDQLLERFPKDQHQWGVKVRLLRQLGSRADRLEVLEGLCGESDVEMVYRHQLIDELLGDPERRDEVDYLLRRCMRTNAASAQTMSLQARRAWVAEDREAALDWSRYAACVELRSDGYSETYFAAATALGRSGEALALLADRFERFGKQDAGPAMSLVDALDQVFQTERALEVLAAALQARPNDGDLRLFACNYFTRLGRHEDAQQQLDAAKGACHEAAWLSTAASVAQQASRFDEAYGHLAEALKSAPLDIGIHRRAVEVLADGRGVAAGIEHLQACVDRFPKSLELRTLLVEYSSELGPEQAEQAAREHLELHPNDAWCWRELGFKLADQRKWDQAADAAEQARRLAPGAMQNDALSGEIHLGLGKEERAREDFLRAIRHSVDYTAAVVELFRLCDSRQDRQRAVAEVLAELKRQVIFGETLHLFRSQAARSHEPDETLAMVREARDARPDLPQAWSVVVEQLLDMNRHDDALAEAAAAVERFPMVPGTLKDLAGVHREKGQADEEIKQLKKALAINSRDGDTLRSLAEAYARSGDPKREEAMLRRACESDPRNVTHRGALADFLWRDGQRDRALAVIREAIDREFRYEWGWNKLAEWSFVVGEPDLLVEMAREITRGRPKSAPAWLQQADLLSRFPEHAEECYAAIERAIELDPRWVDAHEQRAVFLASQGQFDAAVAACRPKAFGERPPLRLRARAAVVQSQRGELDAAITDIRLLLDEDPDYAWAWSQLAEWLQQKGDHEQALVAAKRLLEIAPRAPASWGYVAESLMQQGEVEECKEHLRRSIELDSSYLYGGNALLSLQIDAGEHDDALATLAVIGPHLSDYERLAQEAKLQALAGRQEEALAAVRRASRADAETDDLLRDAADAALLAGWAEPLKAVFVDEMAAGRSTPQAVAVYVEVLAREAQIARIEQLCGELDPTTPHWAEAASAYLEALGESGSHDRLDAFLAPRTDDLRRQSRSWGQTGRALQLSGRCRKAAAWMSDWRQRDDTSPHQFVPLALYILRLGETAEVRAVVDHATAVPLAPATDPLRVLGACADVLDGDPLAAATRLEPVTPQNLPPYYLGLHLLQRAASHAAASIDQGGSAREARAHWKQAYAEHYQAGNDDLFEAIVAHCRLLLARRSGNPIRAWLGERSARRQREKLSC